MGLGGRRLEQATDRKREGIRICSETARALRSADGVAGVHLTAHRHEELVPEILRESGLAGERDTAPTLPGVT